MDSVWVVMWFGYDAEAPDSVWTREDLAEAEAKRLNDLWDMGERPWVAKEYVLDTRGEPPW